MATPVAHEAAGEAARLAEKTLDQDDEAAGRALLQRLKPSVYGIDYDDVSWDDVVRLFEEHIHSLGDADDAPQARAADDSGSRPTGWPAETNYDDISDTAAALGCLDGHMLSPCIVTAGCEVIEADAGAAPPGLARPAVAEQACAWDGCKSDRMRFGAARGEARGLGAGPRPFCDGAVPDQPQPHAAAGVLPVSEAADADVEICMPTDDEGERQSSGRPADAGLMPAAAAVPPVGRPQCCQTGSNSAPSGRLRLS